MSDKIIGGDNQQPQPQQLNIDLHNQPEVHCLACNSIFFHEVVFFKRLSAIISPTGKEQVVPITTFACTSCGNINPEFMPVKLSDNVKFDDEDENAKKPI